QIGAPDDFHQVFRLPLVLLPSIPVLGIALDRGGDGNLVVEHQLGRQSDLVLVVDDRKDTPALHDRLPVVSSRNTFEPPATSRERTAGYPIREDQSGNFTTCHPVGGKHSPTSGLGLGRVKTFRRGGDRR